MKKLLAVLMALLLPASALAAEDLTEYAIANGTVAAVQFVDLTAPFSGTLETFDLEAGDTVSADDELFRLRLTTIYAPEDGKITATFVQPGDDASQAMSRYGALISMEPKQLMQINASTTGAYNSNDNRLLHVGETLYFRSSKTGREEGSGRVVMISGENYVVDILDGDFDLKDSFNLYRGSGYNANDNVGKGTVVRRDPIAISGMGRVCKLFVGEGAEVRAGDPILTLMAADADPDASPVVTSTADGVVAMVAVSPGQQVWKGQVLARIDLTSELEVIAEVDEINLRDLSLGDRLPVTLDIHEDDILYGIVTEISALGVTRQNAAYYAVHVRLSNTDAMLGGSASVYLPKDR